MHTITTTEQWEQAKEHSRSEAVFVMKTSNTCPISLRAEIEYKQFETNVPKYNLVVQHARDISNLIAEELDVRHESPQVFLLKDGECIWQETHSAITRKTLQEAAENFA
ncbi:bacillithiol system redox-active protein YtxJ [Paenisporosarcina cavernae]|nr:bacillithiol system redox-active protein YtxJ [Paenisporosarcina cavernae]